MKKLVGMKIARIATAAAFSFVALFPMHESRAQKKQAVCTLSGDGIVKTRADGRKVHLFGLFDDGEQVREMKCEERRTVVLTTENLTIAEDPKKKNGLKQGTTTKYRLGDVYSSGLVSYALGEERAFFLTKDKTLTVLPYQNGSRDAVSYEYKFDVSKTKLTVENGILFLAPINGKISYCSFDAAGDISCRSKPLQFGGEFFRNNGKLHFGTRDKSLAITAGQALESVKIKNRTNPSAFKVLR